MRAEWTIITKDTNSTADALRRAIAQHAQELLRAHDGDIVAATIAAHASEYKCDPMTAEQAHAWLHWDDGRPVHVRRKTVAEIAEAWAADKTDAALWRADAERILRAVRACASNDGRILDAAHSALTESGYTGDEIDEGDLCEALALAFLTRLIAAEGAAEVAS